jgi:hypothetical protein
MADTDVGSLEERLRTHAACYLRERSPWLRPLADALKRLHGGPRSVYLFGGLLRDLLVLGREASPRDVDLVIGGGTTGDELAGVLTPYIDRRTRFGGLQLMVEGTAVDLWPLQETWAFHRLGLSSPGFADLPRTTFLDVEAVVMELLPAEACGGELHAHGFFESVLARTMEINLEDNPSPGMCVVRSLGLAERLGFGFGPRLASYLASHLGRMTVSELVALQAAESGCIRCSEDAVRRWKEAFAKSSSVGRLLPGLAACG